jgi:endonuclease YncB( thermonuclease family)
MKPQSFLFIAIAILVYAVVEKISRDGSLGIMNVKPQYKKLPDGDIVGVPKLIDADSFKIGNTEIRLFGVDAPEGKQTCKNGSENNEDKIVKCGELAKQQLQNFIGNSEIVCKPIEYDKYQRTVAECNLAQTSLNSWVVANGLAYAYRFHSDKFIPEEEVAKSAKLGVWSMAEQQNPRDFRLENK